MPTYNTTTLNTLRWLTGVNPISEIDAGFQALAEDIDGKLASRVQTIATDAAATLTAVAPLETVLSTGAFTAARTYTLATAGATTGMRFRIVRTGTSAGANFLNVGAGPLKAMITNTWCEVMYTGSVWVLTAYGAL